MSTISHDAPLDQEVLSCHCWNAKCFHIFSEFTGHSCVIIFNFWMLVTSAQCSALLPTMCAAHVTSFRFFLPHNPTNDPATYCNTLSKPCCTHPNPYCWQLVAMWECGKQQHCQHGTVDFRLPKSWKCCSGAPLTNYHVQHICNTVCNTGTFPKKNINLSVIAITHLALEVVFCYHPPCG